MVRFPNCKINLGLHILEKRSDGFHNLETVFYPVQFRDALEILPASTLNKPELVVTGLPVSGDNNNNLCIKAWYLLKEDFSLLPAVQIHLHKAIPMGGGLGGGSADGAFMLMMLNEQFNLGLSTETLAKYALQLGSDCPFFIYNQPVFATGRGEILQPVNVNLNGYYFYLVYPNIHINTGEAFSRLQYITHQISLQEIICLPVEDWKHQLKNDFEKGIVREHSAIGEIIKNLYQHSAIYAAMTGSGSTVFGIFKDEPPIVSFTDTYFTKIVSADVAP